MPFKSKAQHRKFRAMEAAGEIPQGTSSEWAHHTPSLKKLPDRITEKKGIFVMADPIAGLAKQAADDALVEKLASDTQITPDLVRVLARQVHMPVNKFVKLAYQDPADYTIFLKLMSKAATPDQLSAGAQSGPLTKAAMSSLKGALQYLKQKGGQAATGAANTASRAYKGARGSTSETGGVLGTSKAKTGVGRVLEKTPIGKSVAGRATMGTAGVAAAGAGANEAIPGNRFSKPEGGAAGGAAASGMSNAAMPPAGQPQKPPAPAGGQAPGGQAPGAQGQAQGGGMSDKQKALLAGGGVAAGALGVGAMMRKKKQKQVMAFDREFAKDVMRNLIEKKAADLMRKEAADTLIGYLDLVASKMPTEKTAAVRKLQAAVAEGQPLSHAIKLAYPQLTGEQRGILAVDMVEKAAKYQKGKSNFDSGGGGMKVQHRSSTTCKPGEASSAMSKMGGDGMTKEARNLINTIMRNRGAAGLGLGAMGLAGAGAGAGMVGKALKQPAANGQSATDTLNSALKPK